MPGPDAAGPDAAGPGAEKPCATCGRTITWRKKWERDWEAVRYCSDRCRADRSDAGPGGTGEALERSLAGLLDRVRRGGTVCPSEAARDVGGESWRDLMEPARQAARRMVARGEVEITQGGRVVDGSTARGPIRVRRVPR